ncbi:hypothetical protein EVAR_83576_1 [Eumeta japonica]|uniref:Uncharacterized protein n=1 Tax=Eumeta variegata TaxID=151549 RepID=A0A4C1UPG2_EUMVA|nr:hypothetical protein EVAR_83576_1 [Eumeta japonica]
MQTFLSPRRLKSQRENGRFHRAAPLAAPAPGPRRLRWRSLTIPKHAVHRTRRMRHSSGKLVTNINNGVCATHAPGVSERRRRGGATA